MDSSPFVSVIIPSFNRAGVIEKAIKSVLEQTYTNLELIIVDDGSTDNTREVVTSISDPRLKYVYQENAGACVARNRGIDAARGDIIAFHDSDDLWYPDKLSKQILAMEQTGADLVFCKLAMRKKDKIENLFPKHIQEGFVTRKDDIFGIGTQTVVVRRAVVEKERFDPQMPRYQDFEWLFRILGHFRVYCLNEALVDYFIGEDSISVNYEKMYAALQLFYDKYYMYKKECPVMFMHIVRNLAEGWQLARRDKANSSRFIWLMLKYYPGAVRFLLARRRRQQERQHQ